MGGLVMVVFSLKAPESVALPNRVPHALARSLTH